MGSTPSYVPLLCLDVMLPDLVPAQWITVMRLTHLTLPATLALIPLCVSTLPVSTSRVVEPEVQEKHPSTMYDIINYGAP